jgi:nitrile hydratase accessory protein
MPEPVNSAYRAAASCAVPMPFAQDQEPVFNLPWQAQAFAMTLALHERGLFSWVEWAQILSATIKEAQAEGDPDIGDTYYHHWLKTLEKMLACKAVLQDIEISHRQEDWVYSASVTPHGMPISLRTRPEVREL